MTKKPINQYIDQTNIRTDAKRQDIINTCKEAKDYQFRGVCVRPKWVKIAAKELKGTGVKVIALIDDPIGLSEHKKRMKICKQAKADGADELDVVVSIPDVKMEKWEKIEKDLKEICNVLPTKVIIGSGYLTDEEIAKVSSIVKTAGAICVKTATEKDPLENRELEEKARHLKIMRKNAPGLLIKASGKIQSIKDFNQMIKAGADIIGTSNGAKIMKDAKKYV
ncbi:MAG TPA: deoxyribose-phosphate aldolase [Candidatus Pacearchaeota archaeon]|nr:deoxyribose-phosphate aldolase [Candidatus Pacearchaeota archaeon]